MIIRVRGGGGNENTEAGYGEKAKDHELKGTESLFREVPLFLGG
jgi:hypothetical protein